MRRTKIVCTLPRNLGCSTAELIRAGMDVLSTCPTAAGRIMPHSLRGAGV